MLDDFLVSRIIASSEAAVKRMNLDLSGTTVVTECATGIYACTPVIAALGGANSIVAFGKNSNYGTYHEAKDDVLSIWHALDFGEDGLLLTDDEELLEDKLTQADIVTNSGHLRPLNPRKLRLMKQGCVIPLMYEAWEFRANDISLEVCRERDIPVSGTNERNPDIAVFEYLGPLTVQALFHAGLEVKGNTILLISDNDFGLYVYETLTAMGAHVVRSLEKKTGHIDAIVFAHMPDLCGGTLNIASLDLPKNVPVCCQLWGDVERAYFRTRWIPAEEPKAGHMGLMLSSLGVEPIVRLQAGGLKVGEIMVRGKQSGLSARDCIKSSEDKGFGQELNYF